MEIKMWNRFDLKQWNKYLTYNQNLNNGINLPEKDIPVLIHNFDNCKYYVGRFLQDINGEEFGREEPDACM